MPTGTQRACRALGVATALMFGGVAACRHVEDPECKGMSREQCAWNRARRQLEDPERGIGVGDGEGADEVALETGWSGINRILDAATDTLARGLGGKVAMSEVAKYCETEPDPREADGGGQAIACILSDPPAIEGRELTLEAASDGVVSMVGFDFDSAAGTRVIDAAIGRWAHKCIGGSFERVESDGDQRIFRCALPEGPSLVVARYPQDPEDLSSDLWQVSLTVLGPG